MHLILVVLVLVLVLAVLVLAQCMSGRKRNMKFALSGVLKVTVMVTLAATVTVREGEGGEGRV